MNESLSAVIASISIDEITEAKSNCEKVLDIYKESGINVAVHLRMIAHDIKGDVF